jgi:6-phosphogluconolactonase
MPPRGLVIEWAVVRIERVADSAAVAARGAALFASCAARAIEERGQFVVALSGGSTPRALHACLTSDEWRLRVDWPYVEFCWGDERPVPPSHPQSNFGMARETLLAPLGIAGERVHRMQGEASDLARAAADYAAALTRLTGASPRSAPVLDLVLLGMGPDGHTASLFPATAALHVSDRWVAANHVPQLATTRLTVTFPVIHAARTVIVLVTGSEKGTALRAVLTGPPDPDRFPAQRLAQSTGSVTWLVDEAAHAGLA